MPTCPTVASLAGSLSLGRERNPNPQIGVPASSRGGRRQARAVTPIPIPAPDAQDLESARLSKCSQYLQRSLARPSSVQSQGVHLGLRSKKGACPGGNLGAPPDPARTAALTYLPGPPKGVGPRGRIGGCALGRPRPQPVSFGPSVLGPGSGTGVGVSAGGVPGRGGRGGAGRGRGAQEGAPRAWGAIFCATGFPANY